MCMLKSVNYEEDIVNNSFSIFSPSFLKVQSELSAFPLEVLAEDKDAKISTMCILEFCPLSTGYPNELGCILVLTQEWRPLGQKECQKHIDLWLEQ